MLCAGVWYWEVLFIEATMGEIYVGVLRSTYRVRGDKCPVLCYAMHYTMSSIHMVCTMLCHALYHVLYTHAMHYTMSSIHLVCEVAGRMSSIQSKAGSLTVYRATKPSMELF